MRIISAVLTGLALVSVTGIAHGRPVRIIDDPSGEPGGRFGQALATIGTDLAVGAPGAAVFDDVGAGRVRIIGSDGGLHRTLEAIHPGPDAAFGSALATSEELLYVGAPGDRPVGPGGIGAVYVFRAHTGALVRVLRAPDPAQGSAPVGGTSIPGGTHQSTADAPALAGFGRVLAVSSDLVAVGAPDSIVDDLDGAGAVCVFDRAGRLRRTIHDFPPQAGAHFGAAVALVGNLLLVGEPGAEAGGQKVGLVRIIDARTGDPIRTLRAVIEIEGAGFGSVVGAVGDALFVGAPGDRDGAGTVYLFDRETAALRDDIGPPASTPGLAFGGAIVAVEGDLVVGADGDGEQSGRAYLVDPVSVAFQTTFVPTRENVGGRFGFALAAVGTAIAIGEPSPDDGSTNGRVYLFDDATGPSGTAGPGRESGAGNAPLPPEQVAACVAVPTSDSIDCRLGTLLETVRGAKLRSLVGPLRRARRELRHAERIHGRPRAGKLRGAMRGLTAFTSGVQRVAPPTELRASLLVSAEALSADLRTLFAPPAP